MVTSYRAIPSPFGPETDKPPLLSLVETPDRGRAMVASSTIRPGQIVLQESPLLVYPFSLESLAYFCASCFRVLPFKPLTCPHCNLARFCSSGCLLSHPPLLCHALPSLGELSPTCTHDLLFLASAYSLPSTSFNQLLSLHSISKTACESAADILHSQLTSVIPASLFRPQNFSRETTLALMAKKNNAILMMNPTAKKPNTTGPRAWGLYPWASMINHSCVPNVCFFASLDSWAAGQNARLEVRALHRIQEGTEICLTYVGITKQCADRQKELMQTYEFVCNCNRCKRECEEVGHQLPPTKKEHLQEGEEGDVSAFVKKFVCDCGGVKAPVGSSEESVLFELLECNTCRKTYNENGVVGSGCECNQM